MAFEHVIEGTASSYPFLELWEKLVLFIIVGYTSVAALRLATRPRSLPLLSTRGFIAVVALPAALGFCASYLEILDGAVSVVSYRGVLDAAFNLAESQVLLLVGFLASSVVAGAGVLRSQVAADRTAPLWAAVTPGILLAVDFALVLQPEHADHPYVMTVSAAGTVGSFLLLILLSALLFRPRAEQRASPYGRLALAIRVLPFPLAAVGLFLVLLHLTGAGGP